MVCGQTDSIIHYKTGKDSTKYIFNKNSVQQVFYYKNGIIKQIIYFDKAGNYKKSIEYYENGKKREIIRYYSLLYDEVRIMWDENGKKTKHKIRCSKF